MPVTWKVTSTAATVAVSVAVVAAVLVAATTLLTGQASSSSVTGWDAADPGAAVSTGVTHFSAGSRTVAPVIEGPAVVGKEVVSSGHPGRVVVINVWQSTCEPCRAEAEDLEAAALQTKTMASFVGLDVIDHRSSAQEFVRASGNSYPHVFDPDGKQLRQFNGVLPLQAIPSTAIIDRKGRTAARVIGPVSRDVLVELIAEAAAST